MVGVFASLKWRLVTSRLRAAKGSARIGMIIAFVVVLGVVGFLAVGLAFLRTVPDTALPVITTVFALQVVGWVLAPLVAFGVDETVDPARFALLPLRAQTLQRGLLVTSLIGFLPLLNIILLIGAAIGLGVPWSVLPIALICAAAQLVLCVVLSRAASTSMSSLMSGRRGRDLGMLVGFLIFLLYFGFVTVINNPANNGSALESGVRSSASALTWTPPGALAALPNLVATGQYAKAGLAVLIVLAALGLAWWWWSVALNKSLTSGSSTTEGSSPAGREHGGHAVAVGVGGTVAVVADRDRMLMWRDPMRRMPWLMLGVLLIAWPFLVVQGHGALFAIAAMCLFLGAQAANQYGVEGSGLWLHLQTISDRVRARGEVLGHAVAVIIPGGVLVLIAIAVQAIVREDIDKIPAAIGLCFGAFLGSTAGACYLSARMPYAQPQSRKSMFASSVPGQKGRTFAATLGLMGCGLVVAIPAGIAVILSLTVSPLWGWVSLVVGPLVGVVALWIAAGMTANRYLQDAPEIFAVVSAGDRV